MPNILKRFLKSQTEDYHFRDMEQVKADLQDMIRLKESISEGTPPSGAATPEEERVAFPSFSDPAVEPEPEPVPEPQPEELTAGSLEFARTQAEAILHDAEQQAQEILEQARQQAEEQATEIFNHASEEGYQEGFAKGHEAGQQQGWEETRALAERSIQQVQEFLNDAATVRDHSIDRLRNELLNVAIAIAEKVIRISLKSSKDIINRMIISATEKLKKRAWVRIYLADCDVSSTVTADPALASTLAGLSSQVKIIPMQEAESGTCVIEMPDGIIDVSASTQVENIRTIIRDSRP